MLSDEEVIKIACKYERIAANVYPKEIFAFVAEVERALLAKIDVGAMIEEIRSLREKLAETEIKLNDFKELSEWQSRIILIKEENMAKAEDEIERLESVRQAEAEKTSLILNINKELRQKLSEAQKALDGEIALSEFRRNQLVQLQDNEENQQPFKWVFFWVSEFGCPVFNCGIYDTKEHAIEDGKRGGDGFEVYPVYLGPKEEVTK